MDREKVIKEWKTVLSRDPLDAPWDLIDETLALLKEQEPYISKETRLNRDEYCRVGDVLDCFDGMDMKADEVFHAVCLIEWAMSKRSVPLDQLLKEQERKKGSWDYGTQCSVCKGTIIPPKDRKVRVNFCPWCGADMRDSYE